MCKCYMLKYNILTGASKMLVVAVICLKEYIVMRTYIFWYKTHMNYEKFLTIRMWGNTWHLSEINELVQGAFYKIWQNKLLASVINCGRTLSMVRVTSSNFCVLSGLQVVVMELNLDRKVQINWICISCRYAMWPGRSCLVINLNFWGFLAVVVPCGQILRRRVVESPLGEPW